MAIWAIADIHASPLDAHGEPEKPMDVFDGVWADHVAHIERAWERRVHSEDTVIIAGDLDWALYLSDAMPTLHRIHDWPGKKVLLRGNHDFWWSSKTTTKVRAALPQSISLLHNNSFQVEGVNICGAKGSPVPGGIDWTDVEAKLLNRETERLKMSLATGDAVLPTIAAFHYPPFYPASGSSPYVDILRAHAGPAEVGRVVGSVYGHLHGDAASAGPHGLIDGITYRCVAADFVGFTPVLIWRKGAFMPD